MTKSKEYDFQEQQVFFCLREDGYFVRFKPKNNPEKRDMYKTYPFVIQVGVRGKDKVIIELVDGSMMELNPNTIRINAYPKFLTNRKIKTIYLEPKKAS